MSRRNLLHLAFLGFTSHTAPAHEYTYLGEDYPLFYPTDVSEQVAITLHESARFSLAVNDSISNKEWTDLSTWPKGYGRTRLGPQFRVFTVIYVHQMHCLWILQSVITNSTQPQNTPYHFHHCLTFLRQSFTCAADNALEEGDFMDRNFEEDVMGDTLVCNNWEKAYNVLDDAHQNWRDFRDQWI